MMNVKGCGRKWRWLKLNYYSMQRVPGTLYSWLKWPILIANSLSQCSATNFRCVLGDQSIRLS